MTRDIHNHVDNLGVLKVIGMYQWRVEHFEAMWFFGVQSLMVRLAGYLSAYLRPRHTCKKKMHGHHGPSEAACQCPPGAARVQGQGPVPVTSAAEISLLIERCGHPKRQPVLPRYY